MARAGTRRRGPRWRCTASPPTTRGWLWAATAKGLRIVGRGVANLDKASLVLPGDMRDLTRDGFGRLWALSASSIALVSPAPKIVAPTGLGKR